MLGVAVDGDSANVQVLQVRDGVLQDRQSFLWLGTYGGLTRFDGVEFRTFALGTNADITHMTMTGLNYSKAASFDEPILGTAWEDVIPEPATAGVLAVMGLGLAGRRRV